MGLSASQFRFLSLTARQSDLEYQAQMINQARLALASKSSDAAKAYTEGMSNKVVRIAKDSNINGNSTKVWQELTFANLQANGYQIIGTNGLALDPAPFTIERTGEINTHSLNTNMQTGEDGTTVANLQIEISDADWETLDENIKSMFVKSLDGKYKLKNSITGETYNAIKGLDVTEHPMAEYLNYYNKTPLKKANYNIKINEDYKGMDIQSLLVSGRGHIVTQDFFNFLCQHGYSSGVFLDDNGNETTYEKLVEQYQNANRNLPTIIDWRSDVTNMFKQDLYTEDDAAVNANYEAVTAEIQSQDKKLELQLKRIETEHKAIQTEMESVKKVIDKNIESTYKSFG